MASGAGGGAGAAVPAATTAAPATSALKTAADRSKPNILITGTPGTGKTTTSDFIAEALGLKVIHVGDVIKDKGYHAGKDTEFNSYVLDEDSEDKLMDDMEEAMGEGGVIVDFHSCEFFPERWFDLVLVLRASNTVLFDRLKKRGYTDKKVAENVEAEIMQVVLEEAKDSYAAGIVHEVPSNTMDDLESNVDRVEKWALQWVKDHKAEAVE